MAYSVKAKTSKCSMASVKCSTVWPISAPTGDTKRNEANYNSENTAS
jgi:hypothetical protein